MDIKIALAGNPNSGKTTMFNDLTGSSQYVGNWPGVTVEKKEGKLKGHKDVIITDLPGIYSLSPYTLEEVVTRDYLLKEKPDAIINLVDATNLERNLYLTTQLTELGIPVVIALNMIDLLNKAGDVIDIKKLSKEIGCEIVETSALKGKGSMEAAEKALKLAQEKNILLPTHQFGNKVEKALGSIAAHTLFEKDIPSHQIRWFAVKLFERDIKVNEQLKISNDLKCKLEEIIKDVENTFDDDSESIITNERYEYITDLVESCLKKKNRSMSTSDKIDMIVTNRFLALPIFAAVMFIVYFVSVSWLGAILTDWTNDVFFGEWVQPFASGILNNIGVAEWLNSLVSDGIIGGVGAVLGFVPQMFLLFFFLSILEDCGYMARVAFIMDKIFRKFGLSGKSFIPMLISSGCAVPGVMATKTIENQNDRRMTIMTTTFIPCGAKLPIIALIGGAMFPGITWMAPAVYFLGIGAVVISGIMLKKTKLFAGDVSPFIMELPQYHMPAPKGVLIHIWERGKSFIIKAGTVIFVASAIIWFLSNFGFTGGNFAMVNESESLLASLGKIIAPIFVPLGFGNWQSAVATASGLVAKENIVASFGVLLGLGRDISEGDSSLLVRISTLFPYQAAALSFLVFNMLCAPCFAAIGAIRREMASAKWTLFAIGYQTTLAYALALIINQIGGLLTKELSFGFGTAIALTVLVLLLYMLFRPNPYKKKKIPTDEIKRVAEKNII